MKLFCEICSVAFVTVLYFKIAVGSSRKTPTNFVDELKQVQKERFEQGIGPEPPSPAEEDQSELVLNEEITARFKPALGKPKYLDELKQFQGETAKKAKKIEKRKKTTVPKKKFEKPVWKRARSAKELAASKHIVAYNGGEVQDDAKPVENYIGQRQLANESASSKDERQIVPYEHMNAAKVKKGRRKEHLEDKKDPNKNDERQLVGFLNHKSTNSAIYSNHLAIEDRKDRADSDERQIVPYTDDNEKQIDFVASKHGNQIVRAKSSVQGRDQLSIKDKRDSENDNVRQIALYKADNDSDADVNEQQIVPYTDDSQKKLDSVANSKHGKHIVRAKSSIQGRDQLTYKRNAENDNERQIVPSAAHHDSDDAVNERQAIVPYAVDQKIAASSRDKMPSASPTTGKKKVKKTKHKNEKIALDSEELYKIIRYKAIKHADESNTIKKILVFLDKVEDIKESFTSEQSEKYQELLLAAQKYVEWVASLCKKGQPPSKRLVQFLSKSFDNELLAVKADNISKSRQGDESKGVVSTILTLLGRGKKEESVNDSVNAKEIRIKDLVIPQIEEDPDSKAIVLVNPEDSVKFNKDHTNIKQNDAKQGDDEVEEDSIVEYRRILKDEDAKQKSKRSRRLILPPPGTPSITDGFADHGFLDRVSMALKVRNAFISFWNTVQDGNSLAAAIKHDSGSGGDGIQATLLLASLGAKLVKLGLLRPRLVSTLERLRAIVEAADVAREIEYLFDAAMLPALQKLLRGVERIAAESIAELWILMEERQFGKDKLTINMTSNALRQLYIELMTVLKDGSGYIHDDGILLLSTKKSPSHFHRAMHHVKRSILQICYKTTPFRNGLVRLVIIKRQMSRNARNDGPSRQPLVLMHLENGEPVLYLYEVLVGDIADAALAQQNTQLESGMYLIRQDVLKHVESVMTKLSMPNTESIEISSLEARALGHIVAETIVRRSGMLRILQHFTSPSSANKRLETAAKNSAVLAHLVRFVFEIKQEYKDQDTGILGTVQIPTAGFEEVIERVREDLVLWTFVMERMGIFAGSIIEPSVPHSLAPAEKATQDLLIDLFRQSKDPQISAQQALWIAALTKGYLEERVDFKEKDPSRILIEAVLGECAASSSSTAASKTKNQKWACDLVKAILDAPSIAVAERMALDGMDELRQKKIPTDAFARVASVEDLHKAAASIANITIESPRMPLPVPPASPMLATLAKRVGSLAGRLKMKLGKPVTDLSFAAHRDECEAVHIMLTQSLMPLIVDGKMNSPIGQATAMRESQVLQIFQHVKPAVALRPLIEAISDVLGKTTRQDRTVLVRIRDASANTDLLYRILAALANDLSNPKISHAGLLTYLRWLLRLH